MYLRPSPFFPAFPSPSLQAFWLLIFLLYFSFFHNNINIYIYIYIYTRILYLYLSSSIFISGLLQIPTSVLNFSPISC
ncbi:MAG: hypothetical protein N7Q72_03495, partial [Spiroplasma sp. Tabriz.8]|nr:hypothetical protein [Spiroplasma sp. Tabriz.8]